MAYLVSIGHPGRSWIEVGVLKKVIFNPSHLNWCSQVKECRHLKLLGSWSMMEGIATIPPASWAVLCRRLLRNQEFPIIEFTNLGVLLETLLLMGLLLEGVLTRGEGGLEHVLRIRPRLGPDHVVARVVEVRHGGSA